MNNSAQYAYSQSDLDSRKWISFRNCPPACCRVNDPTRRRLNRATHVSKEASGFIVREIEVGEAILAGREVCKIGNGQMHGQLNRVADRRFCALTLVLTSVSVSDLTGLSPMILRKYLLGLSGPSF